MGSVKDLEVLEEPKKEEAGKARFHFSDRYSVFDWGEMPDQITNKGASLCLMGAYFFEKLNKKEIGTHYKGLVTQEGEIKTIEEITTPTDKMEVDLLRVFEPQVKNKGYDYSKYRELEKKNEGNFLIPLEIIYRNGLPEGSSVFRRLKNGNMDLKDFGLEKKPEPGQELDNPIYDVSTKLEEKDRYIKWTEAKKIASISQREISEIKRTLKEVNETITKEVKEIGLRNEDGKIEVGFNVEREVIVVDVVGTLDECRFTYNGTQISKEIARKYYKQTDWYKEVRKAKNKAKEKGENNWKKYCNKKPPMMKKEIKDNLSKLYMSMTNELLDKEIFESPSLKEVIKEYKKIEEEYL